MKKLLFLIILILVPFSVTSAFAKNPRVDKTGKNETYRIASHEVINHDVIAAAEVVEISGIVTQDLRVAGGQVTVNGVVSRNASVVGGNIEFTDAATLQGSLVAAGGN